MLMCDKRVLQNWHISNIDKFYTRSNKKKGNVKHGYCEVCHLDIFQGFMYF